MVLPTSGDVAVPAPTPLVLSCGVRSRAWPLGALRIAEAEHADPELADAEPAARRIALRKVRDLHPSQSWSQSHKRRSGNLLAPWISVMEGACAGHSGMLDTLVVSQPNVCRSPWRRSRHGRSWTRTPRRLLRPPQKVCAIAAHMSSAQLPCIPPHTSRSIFITV